MVAQASGQSVRAFVRTNPYVFVRSYDFLYLSTKGYPQSIDEGYSDTHTQ